MKAIALISGVIFTAILVLAIFLAYNMSVPVVQNMKSSAEINQMSNVFSIIDNAIQAVVTEGVGSKRSLPVRIDYGEIKADSEKNKIVYSINVNFPYISPRTQQTIGNIRIGSNLNAFANETVYEGNDAFFMENEHLKVYIKKIGNRTEPQPCNTGQLILGIYQKDTSKWFAGSFSMSVDNKTESETGVGYTSLENKGDYYLPYGKVTAFINTTYINYYIDFVLESGADFIQIKGHYAS